MIISGPYLLSAPRKNRPHQRESFWEVECEYCHKTRFLRKKDIKNTPCKACAAILRELKKVAIDPNALSSEAELQYMDYLDRIGVPYDRQVPLWELGCIVDFKVLTEKGPVYVEIRGKWHAETKKAKDLALEESEYCVVFVDV